MLGYCEAGIECLRQHVRECPDFAENGACPNKFCKLPHVIRANRARKQASTAVLAEARSASASVADDLAPSVAAPATTVEEAQLGDEYISLTFNESEEDEESSDDDDEEDDNQEDDNHSPNDDDIAQE